MSQTILSSSLYSKGRPTKSNAGPHHPRDISNYHLCQLVENEGMPLVLYNQGKYAILVPTGRDVHIACAGCFKNNCSLHDTSRVRKISSHAQHFATKNGNRIKQCTNVGVDSLEHMIQEATYLAPSTPSSAASTPPSQATNRNGTCIANAVDLTSPDGSTCSSDSSFCEMIETPARDSPSVHDPFSRTAPARELPTTPVSAAASIPVPDLISVFTPVRESPTASRSSPLRPTPKRVAFSPPAILTPAVDLPATTNDDVAAGMEKYDDDELLRELEARGLLNNTMLRSLAKNLGQTLLADATVKELKTTLNDKVPMTRSRSMMRSQRY